MNWLEVRADGARGKPQHNLSCTYSTQHVCNETTDTLSMPAAGATGHQDAKGQRHGQPRHTSVRAPTSPRSPGKISASDATSLGDSATHQDKANASQMHQMELQDSTSIPCSPITSSAATPEATAPQDYLSEREQLATADLGSSASGLGQPSSASSSTVQTLEAALESGSPASLTSAIHAAVKHLASADPAGSSVPEVSSLAIA